jgi:transcriptional regulator
MYTPSINAEHEPQVLKQFIRDNPLCALVTQTANGMVASHIPMVLHDEGYEFGTLRGHVARANSQWHSFTSPEALGIFTGPQHYISASWYPGKITHGKEVPTWNYVAVHVYGQMRVIEDPAWLLEHLRTLTDQSEVVAETPWSVDDAPPDFIAKLSKGIVGIEIQVTRIEGKWKVSQNRTDTDIIGVAAGLDTLATPESAVMKDLIHARRPKNS